MQYRAMKNSSRIGKRFKVVQGEFRLSLFSGKESWSTDFMVSEHNTKKEANEAKDYWNGRIAK